MKKLKKFLVVVISVMLILTLFTGTVSAKELDPSVNSNSIYWPVLYNYKWEQMTTVVRTQQTAKYFIITANVGSHQEDLFISFPVEGGFRMQSLHEVQKEQGLTAPEKSHAGLFEPETISTIDYKNTANSVLMKGTDGTVVIYTQDGNGGFRLQVSDNTGDNIVAIGSGQISYAYKKGVVIRTMLEMPLNSQEAIQTGGGHMNATNQVGESVSLTVSDQCADDEYAYIVTPIYHSNRGYSMWFNMSYYGQQDVGDTNPNKYFITFDSEEGVNLDLFLWAGTPQENIEKYTAITGTSGLSPTWSFGYWIGAPEAPLKKKTGDQYTTLIQWVEGLKSNYGFYPDAAYLEGTNVTNPTAMSFLQQRGVKALAWWRGDDSPGYTHKFLPEAGNTIPAYPTVDANGKIVTYGYPFAYNTFLLKNFGIYQFVANHDGQQYACTFDYTNPHMVTAVSNEFAKMWKLGVRGSMIDFGEWGLDYGTYSNGLTHWQMHNLMSYYYAKTTSTAFTNQWGGDYVLFQRSGFTGSQYWTSNFLGDQTKDLKGYLMQMRAVINMGAGGYNLYGGDLGGFASGTVSNDLWNRWTQLCTFQPYMRNHGGELVYPWQDKGQLQAKMFGNYYYFRKNIVPSIESAAIDANKTANPIVKGMLVAYPDHLELKDIDDQYLFCDDYLVCPVTNEYVHTEKVTLPLGSTWYDLYSYKAYQGGSIFDAEAPTSMMPVYVRGGSVKAINLPESMQLGAQMYDDSGDEYQAIPSLLITPPDEERNTTIYVKDGESTDYRTYDSHVEEYTNAPGENATFTITNKAGSPRQIVLALGVTAAAVQVDGRSLYRLDHTPDYLNQEFGYVVDANGTTTMLLPAGWKELTVTKGDAKYAPLAMTGKMAGMDYLFDGAASTSLRASQGFEVELEEATEVDRVVVKWTTAYYDNYDVEYSENGEDWYWLTTDEDSNNTVENGCGSIDDIRFETVLAKYLRFTMVTPGDATGIPAVYAIEAYAPADLASMTIAPSDEELKEEYDDYDGEYDDEYDEEDGEEEWEGVEEEDAETNSQGKKPNKKKQVVTKRIIYGLPTWVIILIVAGGVSVAAGSVLLFLFLRKKKKKAEQELANIENDIVDVQDFPEI